MRLFITIFVIFMALFNFAPLAFAQASEAAASSVGTQEINVKSVKDILVQDMYQKKIVQTLFVIGSSYFLLFVLIKFINTRVKDIKARHTVRKNIVYIITFVVIISVIFIWIQNLNYLTIFLGVAGAGLALALQEVIMSVAGWILILVRRPFEIGERIEINNVKGDIIDIRLFQTSMLEIGNWVDADQSTGRIVNFPNSLVFKSPNYNYSRGFEFIWNEIPILLTFESDWKVGRDIMIAHARKYAEGLEENVRRKIDAMRNRYMIFYGKLTPIVYVNIKDSGIELTLRYLTEAKKRRYTQDILCQAILDEFEKHPNVNFAYPTYRIVKE